VGDEVTGLAAPAAVWVDRDYHRECASDGTSRFGAYLRDAVFEPWTDGDQTVEWAVFAWARATGPVMSPGYVRYHPSVLGARLERSGWDGGLVADVTLVSAWPQQLTGVLARPVWLGGKDAWWHDWPAEDLGGTVRYHEPGEADLAARPFALATLSLSFTLPSAGLPAPPVRPAGVLAAGQQAVAVLVAELNRVVGPVLAAGAGGKSAVAGSAGS